MFEMVYETAHAEEGSGKLGTPESSGMATSVLTLDCPMGKKKAKTAAKFGDFIAQVMGKEMKECTKFLERKTLLEHNLKCWSSIRDSIKERRYRKSLQILRNLSN